jgi:hypothetical protein
LQIFVIKKIRNLHILPFLLTINIVWLETFFTIILSHFLKEYL